MNKIKRQHVEKQNQNILESMEPARPCGFETNPQVRDRDRNIVHAGDQVSFLTRVLGRGKIVCSENDELKEEHRETYGHL